MKNRKHNSSSPLENVWAMEAQALHVVHNQKNALAATDTHLRWSVLLNILLISGLVLLLCQHQPHIASRSSNGRTLQSMDETSPIVGKPMIFHGGHPTQELSGQCWCGAADSYCMCTPSLAVDLIIASGPEHLWLVRRKDARHVLATMGGFVLVGETVENAVKRELKEEMGIDLNGAKMYLFGVYSDPRRDNRRSTASAVFVVHLEENHSFEPRASDDVKSVERIPLEDVEQYEYFADHKTILMDYKKSVERKINAPKNQEYGDFSNNIARSTCVSLGLD